MTDLKSGMKKMVDELALLLNNFIATLTMIHVDRVQLEALSSKKFQSGFSKEKDAYYLLFVSKKEYPRPAWLLQITMRPISAGIMVNVRSHLGLNNEFFVPAKDIETAKSELYSRLTGLLKIVEI